MSFVGLLGAASGIVVFAVVRSHIKAARLARLDWDDLIAKLQTVPSAGISTIAVDYLRPVEGQLKIENDEVWKLIGGYEGIRRMYANAEVMVALAGYAERWNQMESAVVGQRMRRDAAVLRRATFTLSISLSLQYGKATGPFAVQEAASAYHLMRERLLALYATSHAGRYSRLVAAL